MCLQERAVSKTAASSSSSLSWSSSSPPPPPPPPPSSSPSFSFAALELIKFFFCFPFLTFQLYHFLLQKEAISLFLNTQPTERGFNFRWAGRCSPRKVGKRQGAPPPPTQLFNMWQFIWLFCWDTFDLGDPTCSYLRRIHRFWNCITTKYSVHLHKHFTVNNNLKNAEYKDYGVIWLYSGIWLSGIKISQRIAHACVVPVSFRTACTYRPFLWLSSIIITFSRVQHVLDLNIQCDSFGTGCVPAALL